MEKWFDIGLTLHLNIQASTEYEVQALALRIIKKHLDLDTRSDASLTDMTIDYTEAQETEELDEI